MAFFFCFNSFGSCGIIAAEKGGAGGEGGIPVQLGGPKAACATCPPQACYNSRRKVRGAGGEGGLPVQLGGPKGRLRDVPTAGVVDALPSVMAE